jgi:hypothetical protein
MPPSRSPEAALESVLMLLACVLIFAGIVTAFF